jgi:hypothetical protein
MAVYLSTIRQVIYAGSRFFGQSSIPCGGTRSHQTGSNGSSGDGVLFCFGKNCFRWNASQRAEEGAQS